MNTNMNASLVFDQAEFELLCNDAKIRYSKNIQNNPYGPAGAIFNTIVEGIPNGAELYHSMRSDGYTTMDPMSPLQSFNVLPGGLYQSSVELHLIKPEALQQAELEVVYERVRSNYEVTLEQRMQAAVAQKMQERAQEQAEVKRQAQLLQQQAEMKAAEKEAEEIKKAILAELMPKAKTTKKAA